MYICSKMYTSRIKSKLLLRTKIITSHILPFERQGTRPYIFRKQIDVHPHPIPVLGTGIDYTGKPRSQNLITQTQIYKTLIHQGHFKTVPQHKNSLAKLEKLNIS